MKTPILLADELMTNEIAEFLVQANKDLVIAEQAEQFEQCELIQTAIHLYLQNHAILLATQERPTSFVFNILQEQSKYCFGEIKAKYNNK